MDPSFEDPVVTGVEPTDDRAPSIVRIETSIDAEAAPPPTLPPPPPPSRAVTLPPSPAPKGSPATAFQERLRERLTQQRQRDRNSHRLADLGRHERSTVFFDDNPPATSAAAANAGGGNLAANSRRPSAETGAVTPPPSPAIAVEQPLTPRAAELSATLAAAKFRRVHHVNALAGIRNYRPPDDLREVPKQSSERRFGPVTLFPSAAEIEAKKAAGAAEATSGDDASAANNREEPQPAPVTPAILPQQPSNAQNRRPARRPPTTQLEVADPSFWDGIELPIGQRMGDRAGRFFLDEPEDSFFAANIPATTSDHPDEVLRRAGLIKQTATHSKFAVMHSDVYFDERVRLWRTVDTNFEVAVKATDLSLRYDAVPSGVIAVVGTLDCRNFIPPEEKMAERIKRDETARELRSAEGFVADRAARRGRSSSASAAAATTAGATSVVSPTEGNSRRGSVAAVASGHSFRRADPNAAAATAASVLSPQPFSPSPGRSGRRSSSAGLALAQGGLPTQATAPGAPAPAPAPASPHTLKIAARSLSTATYDRRRRFDGYDVRLYDRDDEDVESIIDIGDPTAEFLSNSEILKFIKHYLSRGVVNVAKGTKSSIVTSGVDDVSRLLAEGFFGLCDAFGIKHLNPREVPTMLVSVNPMVCALHHQLHTSFSRHILVETEGKHLFPNCPTKGDLCMRCGTAFNGGISHLYEFCQKRAPPTSQYCRVGTSLEFEANAANPPPHDFVDFKHALLETLNEGYRRDLSLDMAQPPNRPQVPVVVVLVGGTDVSAAEVRRAVARGWPILAVAGSGGFASRICSAVQKVNELQPDAGPDEFRKLLGTIDATTSEIINNGKLEVIKPGTSVEQFQRLLNNALKGDQILHQAWFLYSVWNHNVGIYKYLWQQSSIVMLMVGLGATLVSVLQTFLILYWKTQGTDYVSQWQSGVVRRGDKYLYMFYVGCQWLVIGLPIMLTLLHAIFQRLNPWGKLSALRIASDGLLREIYMYRTRTQRYSNAAVRKARKKGKNAVGGSVTAAADAAETLAKRSVGSKDDPASSSPDAAASAGGGGGGGGSINGGEITSYSSREELLGLMVARLQNTLAASAIKETSLVIPDDTVPPRSITAFGDTGFYDLSPDDFVKFRLLPAKMEFEEDATSSSRQLIVLMSLVIIFSAVGTTIAAISAYGLGYLQAWVAFATAVVNSFNRFLDATRLASLTELSNATVHRLSDVERWWTALGTGADDEANRSKLVGDTERILRDELEDWAKQLQVSQEEMRKLEEEQKKARAEAQAQREVEAQREVKALASMGIEALAPTSIEAALADPSGPQAVKLRQQLLALDDKLGNAVSSELSAAATAAAATTATATLSINASGGVAVEVDVKVSAAAASEDHTSAANVQSWLFTEGTLGEKMSTVVEGSGQIRGLFVDPKLQLHLLLAFNNPAADLNPREITSFSLRKILSLYSTEVSSALQTHFDSADVLEIARTLVGHTILAIFKSQFERDGLMLSDALTGPFISTFAQIAATCSPKVHLTQQTICQLTKDPGVKQLLLEATPETVISVMDIAKRILVLDPPGSDANADASGNVRTKSPTTTGFSSSFSAKFTIPRLDATDAFNDAEEAQLFSENGLRRAFALYHAITNEIAHLQVDRVAQDPKSYLLHMQALTTLESHSVTLNSLTKHQVLLAMTSPEIRKAHADKSLLELLCFLSQLSVGSGSTRAYRECYSALEQLLSPKAMGIFNDIFFREIFITACGSFTQIELNVMERGDVLRKLQGTRVMTNDVMALVTEGMSDAELRESVSMIQAAQSNGFDVRIIDELSDMFTLVDLRHSLDLADKEEFVRAVGRLPHSLLPFSSATASASPTPSHGAATGGPFLSASSSSHDELLKIAASEATTTLFAPLQTRQLQSILLQLRLLLNNPYFDAVLADIRRRIANEDYSTVKMKLLEHLSPLGAQRLCFSVWRMSPSELAEVTECSTLVEALRKINDRLVSEELLGVCPEPRLEGTYRWEFLQLVEDIYTETQGKLAEQLWAKSFRKVRAFCFGLSRDAEAVLYAIHGNKELLVTRAMSIICEAGDFGAFNSSGGGSGATTGFGGGSGGNFGASSSTGSGIFGAGDSSVSAGMSTSDAVRLLRHFLRDFVVPPSVLESIFADEAAVRHVIDAITCLAVSLVCDLSYTFFCQMGLGIDRYDLWDLFPSSIERHALPLIVAALSLDPATQHIFKLHAPSRRKGQASARSATTTTTAAAAAASAADSGTSPLYEFNEAEVRTTKAQLVAAIEGLMTDLNGGGSSSSSSGMTAAAAAASGSTDSIPRPDPFADGPRSWRRRNARIEEVLACVHAMTPSQVPRLVHVAAFGLQRTPLGQLLRCLCEGLAASAQVSSSDARGVLFSPLATVISCANLLVASARTDPAGVRSACMHFNADAFAAEALPKKRELLERVIPDETVANTVATLDVPEDAQVATKQQQQLHHQHQHQQQQRSTPPPPPSRSDTTTAGGAAASASSSTTAAATTALFVIMRTQTRVDENMMSWVASDAAQSLDNFRANDTRARAKRRAAAAAAVVGGAHGGGQQSGRPSTGRNNLSRAKQQQQQAAEVRESLYSESSESAGDEGEDGNVGPRQQTSAFKSSAGDETPTAPTGGGDGSSAVKRPPPVPQLATFAPVHGERVASQPSAPTATIYSDDDDDDDEKRLYDA